MHGHLYVTLPEPVQSVWMWRKYVSPKRRNFKLYMLQQPEIKPADHQPQWNMGMCFA